VRLIPSRVLAPLGCVLRATLDHLYGTYALLVFGSLGATAWIICALVPDTAWCWRFTHRLSRLFLYVTGMRLDVHGLEHVLPGRSCVLAVNHASFLDGLIMAAALPEPTRFVAKREFTQQFLARVYLTRIGTEFVERIDRQRSLRDTRRLISTMGSGYPLIFFPEGTFRSAPGLLAFQMGAFVIAACAGTPVIPVTLRGTRTVLPEHRWLFRRAALSATFSEPVAPLGASWSAAVDLRDRTRAEILRHSGEPDLESKTVSPVQRAS